MARIAFLAVLLASLVTTPAMAADDLAGIASAIDGKRLKIGETTVRLFGVDAPDLKQTCLSRKGKTQHCGDIARQMMETVLRSMPIKCHPKGKDPDGAVVAVCYAGPFDINEQMVGTGWAVPDRDESEAYVRAETFARARHEGMWRGSFTPPKQWRAENPNN